MVTHGKPQLYENMFIIQAAGKGLDSDGVKKDYTIDRRWSILWTATNLRNFRTQTSSNHLGQVTDDTQFNGAHNNDTKHNDTRQNDIMKVARKKFFTIASWTRILDLVLLALWPFYAILATMAIWHL